MAIDVALTHETRYRYDRLVQMGPQTIRLRPAPHCRSKVKSYALQVAPQPHFLNWQQDPQGNYIARVVFPEPCREFSARVDLVVQMAVLNPFDFFLEPEAEAFPFDYPAWLDSELAPYRTPLPAGPLLTQWLSGIPDKAERTIDFLVDLNQRLQQQIRYVIRMEPGIQTCEETLANGSGSCRDTGWLLVQILRHLGLAARFTSGYLIQLKPDVKPLDGPAGAEEDFTDLHAWTEVYLPGAGWIGFDPTSGLLAGEGHLPLACTPEPESAAPISGTIGDCHTDFGFSMTVSRIRETPRVTKPYTDEQWAAILATGDRVDAQLQQGDVRLTVGGEPTFVSIDDMDGDEWNTLADGPNKRRLAAELIERLRDRFAPGGLLHFGQGKWYPGESLPRWAFSLLWRRDDEPLWQNPNLIVREQTSRTVSLDDAEAFAESLADALEIDRGCVLPAYEDPVPYLAREQMLPENVDVFDSKLEDPEERARLVRVFERGLGNPVGFVLPVQRWNARDGGRWLSQRWSFRRGRLFLMPGDSPIGFRLPLGALAWISPEAYPYYTPADPMAERPPLPPVARDGQMPAQFPPSAASQPRLQQRSGSFATDPARDRRRQMLMEQSSAANDGELVRTAMAIELRDGQVSVFMPPLETAEDYVTLINAVEDTAASLDLPIRLEGYLPPSDHRLDLIKVTPDPGVIEVNIHPAHSWRQLVDITLGLYEDARQTRLGTEKFMLDGRHTGTGGGNHIVVGGPSPADSPFLRRPDLLRSLVTYWQNHPALSFLFSGLFIGPTSQAPRVDEARDDQLYELELAFRQIPEPDSACPPWLIDRILRNLLIDSTGNTHRAEICIDKLYSPDGPSGRLGLVEFRAFEMPPHPQMSLAQHLLLRSLIAWFWREPYRRPLIRWGNALHDRFMLPHFVWRDLLDVLRDLDGAGTRLSPDWFAPHFEFRFPLYGSVEHDGAVIELRQALEPWHVMGEEGGVGSTVRYVDSSVERLQVRVSGLTEHRHVLTCNRTRLPLQPTGRKGEFVAGVRYRAWQPPSCLHPTLGINAPLTFDLFDQWSGRSLGGCTYHVSHPGGRSYDTFPVNAYEAESRRGTRFFPIGHTVGPFQPAMPPPHDDFPMTLDLRWMAGAS